ncbi:hypothetical protein QTP88_014283 [Uroleucon formosanum]
MSLKSNNIALLEIVTATIRTIGYSFENRKLTFIHMFRTLSSKPVHPPLFFVREKANLHIRKSYLGIYFDFSNFEETAPAFFWFTPLWLALIRPSCLRWHIPMIYMSSFATIAIVTTTRKEKKEENPFVIFLIKQSISILPSTTFFMLFLLYAKFVLLFSDIHPQAKDY